jgi:hypothetical protein
VADADEVGDVVGEVVGDELGEVVGEVVGDDVGAVVDDVVGEVGDDVVGEVVGDDVGGEVVGDVVGWPVGEVEVGEAVEVAGLVGVGAGPDALVIGVAASTGPQAAASFFAAAFIASSAFCIGPGSGIVVAREDGALDAAPVGPD